jgi:hypothetical protein
VKHLGRHVNPVGTKLGVAWNRAVENADDGRGVTGGDRAVVAATGAVSPPACPPGWRYPPAGQSIGSASAAGPESIRALRWVGRYSPM